MSSRRRRRPALDQHLRAAAEAASAGFRVIGLKLHDHSMVSTVIPVGDAVGDAVGGLRLPALNGAALNTKPRRRRATHPGHHPNLVVGPTPERCADRVRQGGYIEHSLLHHHPDSRFGKWSLDVLLGYVRATGLDHTHRRAGGSAAALIG